MASIQKLLSPLTGDVSYRAQVRVKGHASQSATFPSRAEAQKWSKSVEAAITEGRYFPQARASRTSFAEAVARYKDSALADIDERGRHTRSQHLDYFLDRFAGLTLAEVTPDRVATARDHLASGTYTRGKAKVNVRGKEVAPAEYARSGATVNRYLATLSHLFSMAQKEWRLVDRNPVREISKKRESRGRIRFLSDDERERLIAACEASEWKPLKALVLLAISTGARRGELAGLTWDRVDFRRGQATIYETKNGDPRVLPLVGKALEALRDLKLQNSARSAFVFPHPNGLPEAYYHFDAHWYAALTEAKLNDFRFHDLRHTTASYLAQQGASLLEIADTLGHRTMAMVKRYSHLAQSHKVSVIERMAKEKGL